MKDLDIPNYCLGIEFVRTGDQVIIRDCKPVTTPLNVNVKLTKEEHDIPEDEKFSY